MRQAVCIGTLVLVGFLSVGSFGKAFAQKGGRGGAGKGAGDHSAGHRGEGAKPGANRSPAMTNHGGKGGTTPNHGENRPGEKPGQKPGERPNPSGQPGGARPNTPGQRPGAGTGVGQRPSNAMNDFMGGNAANRGGPGSRPGIGNNSNNNAQIGRGNENNRTNVGNNTNKNNQNSNNSNNNNRTNNIGNNDGNTFVNNGNINVGNRANYNQNRQQWVDNRHNNGNQVRNNVGNRFWNGYNRPGWHAAGGYGYWGGWSNPGYGWGGASWAGLGAFYGSALAAQSQPAYYAYGTGGNVSYANNKVYVNGEDSGTPAEYAQQAQSLAQAAPASDDSKEWMPLGVFALSREGVTDSQSAIELAVNKAGVIGGTYHNESSGVSRPIKGTADLKSQRAAFSFADGKNSDVVIDTGLYNLTQDEAPALMHFGTDDSQPVLLVRLQQPEAQK